MSYNSKQHFLKQVKLWHKTDLSKKNLRFELVEEGVCIIFDNEKEKNLQIIELFPEELKNKK